MTLQEVLIRVRDGGVAEAFNMAVFLREQGYVKNEFVGVDPDKFDDNMTLRWYLGQGISIVEDNEWIAMNSWLHCIEKYVPESYQLTHFDEDLFVI